MELFSITCDTCASRLKVRQKSAIGQILACPKCESMIKIEAPEGWVPPESTSQIVDESDLADLRDPQMPTFAAQAGAPQTGDAATNATQTAQRPQRQVVVGQSKKKDPLKPNNASSASDQPVLPNDQWTHQTAKQKQKVVLLICSAAGVLIAVLSVIGFLVSRISSDNEKDPIANSIADENDNKLKPISNDPKHDKSDKSKSEKGKSADAKTNGKGKAKDADGKGKAGKSDSDKKLDPLVSGGNGGGDKKEKAKPVNPDDPKLVVGPANANKKNGNKADPGDQGPLNPDIENSQNILDQLGPLSEVLGQETRELRNDALGMDHESGIGIGRIYIPKPRKVEIKVDAWIDDVLPEVEFPPMSLNQFLRAVSQSSNVPIKIDVDSLIYHGIDYTAEVRFVGTDVSWEEMIKQTVEPLGLTYEKKPWGILVFPANIDALTEREYEIFPFDDATDEKYAELAEFLKKRFAPNSWLETGGQGDIVRTGRKFKINQSAKVHFWLNRYFSKVNGCRDVVTGTAKIEESDFLLSDLQSSQSTLSFSSNLDIIVARRMQPVLAKVEKESGLVIAVDWPALIASGWLPSTKIPWESKDRPIEKTLNEIVRSMDLRYRIVNSKTIQITTKENVEQSLSLEIYPAGNVLKNMTEKQFRNQVSGAFGDQIDGSKGMSAMYYEPCQCVIAVLPQPLHRRLQRIMEIMAREK